MEEFNVNSYYPHEKESERTEPFVYKVKIPDVSDPDTFDSRCDPDNPVEVSGQDVIDARERIKDGIIETPCKYSPKLSSELNMQIYLKEDFRQVTGSFKERGCRNAFILLDEEQRKHGVIAASAGNHALGLAYHGKCLGIEVTVVMPVTAPLLKIRNCISYGARVIVNGKSISESKCYALKLARLNRLKYVNGYDDRDILAGQGSIGLEIMEQVPDAYAIIVPVGGGGMLAGICAAVRNDPRGKQIKIYAVESERSPGWTHAVEVGKPTYTNTLSTLADGLNVQVVGHNSFKTANGKVDASYTVSEGYIAKAILRLVETEKVVVEGAAGTSLGALYGNVIPGLEGKKVVCVLGGGNIDAILLCRVLERGLAFDGKLSQFTIIVPDVIGSISKLSTLLVHLEASIVDIYHERIWLVSEIFSVQVSVTIVTKDRQHSDHIRKVLETNYKQILWGGSKFAQNI
ncbi:hypothetical protein Ciccas_006908 [Cichlidogyrus casuarinus]|uniref:Serine racemase n=1 Tax=Cichlidogyrus casuarinus TaxID=1844966 RepID=A0ABD2Q4D5_9PLAT